MAANRMPKLWPGGTAIVMASGPSLTPEDVQAAVEHGNTIAINNVGYDAPGADVLYFCDDKFYREHHKMIRRFAGRVVTLENYRIRDSWPELLCVHNMGCEGFFPEPHGVMTGRASGYQAIQVAIHMGAKRVLLLGFDCKSGAKGRHYFGDHRKPLGNPSEGLFQQWVRSHDELAKQLTRRGIEVVNCTRDSAITAWPRASLQDAIAKKGKEYVGQASQVA